MYLSALEAAVVVVVELEPPAPAADAMMAADEPGPADAPPSAAAPPDIDSELDAAAANVGWPLEAPVAPTAAADAA